MFVWRVSLTYPLPLRSLPLLSVEVDEELPIRLRSAPRVSRWTKAETSRLGARPRPPARCFLVSHGFPKKKDFIGDLIRDRKMNVYTYIYIYCVYTYRIISLGISYDLCGNMRDISPQDVIRVCRNSPLKALDVIWI